MKFKTIWCESAAESPESDDSLERNQTLSPQTRVNHYGIYLCLVLNIVTPKNCPPSQKGRSPVD